jgi:TetR/AcrR family transcriptional regulator, fatty acid metabolism regulator protein
MPKKGNKSNRKKKNPVKYKAILASAKEIFAEKGFSDATISEIAKKSQVSEATIYEYFGTKENVLFAIPFEKISEHQAKNAEIGEYIKDPKSKLRFLIFRHLELYTYDPEFAKIVMLNLKTNRNFIYTKVYQVIQESSRNTIRLLEEGIKSGEFRADIPAYLIRSMIWGTIEHLTIRQSLLGKPENLLEFADRIADIIFDGICPSEKC